VDSPLKQLYQQHLVHIQAADLDSILNDYAEDAVLTTFQGVISGREALARYYRHYLAGYPRLGGISTDTLVEALDSLYVEAVVRASGEEIHVYNAFVIRDGKITHQFAGVK
jgi:ketosteroid isomerase-like protein